MKNSAWLLCWLLPAGLSCAEAVSGVKFEAVPAVIQAGQGAALRIQHSDSRPSTLWQILPSRGKVPVAKFAGPLPSGVDVLNGVAAVGSSPRSSLAITFPLTGVSSEVLKLSSRAVGSRSPLPASCGTTTVVSTSFAALS